MIPKIVHFIRLKEEDTPPSAIDILDRWAELHPGWKAVIWEEAAVVGALGDHPFLRVAWDRYPVSSIMRTMIAKLTALWTQGGVALEFDIYAVRSMDQLVETEDENFFATGLHGGLTDCLFAAVPHQETIGLMIERAAQEIITPLELLERVQKKATVFNLLPEHYFCPIRTREQGIEFLRKWPSDQEVDLQKRRQRYTDNEMPFGVRILGLGPKMPPLFGFAYPNTPSRPIVSVPGELDDGRKASFLQKAKNAAKAAKRLLGAAVKNEKIQVSPEEVQRRITVCQTSGEGGKACHYLKGASCTKCGCVLTFKQRLATESCPLGRW